jgi:hypothetical protein
MRLHEQVLMTCSYPYLMLLIDALHEQVFNDIIMFISTLMLLIDALTRASL